MTKVCCGGCVFVSGFMLEATQPKQIRHAVSCHCYLPACDKALSTSLRATS
ncbi:exported hypothetical protein [Xenorhabdus bovienii str. kraussei Becker Underwood]|uniref:Uncharacterized protein n=1 Tax=Xenorhabdus bovienii str. kraussei Becker Underwood TaxID=1398204 RepID=A0A077PV55_XENBV|nr:exported hypothetical protein [Xenorhabdus bovienii str. kraussei Becker Underwood]